MTKRKGLMSTLALLTGICLTLANCTSAPASPTTPPVASSSTEQLSATATLTSTPTPLPTPTHEPNPTDAPVDPSATSGDGVVAAIVHDTLALVDLAECSSQPLLEATLPTYTHLHFDWSPDGNKIVYARLADLWLVDVKTHRTWNLTNTPDRWELLPSWSPDGETIAFTSRPLDPREEGATEGTMYGAFGGQLTLIQVDGSDYRLLDEQVTIRSSSPGWSPDAQRLAYASEGHLYVYDLEQEERRIISLADYGLSSDLDACAPS